MGGRLGFAGDALVTALAAIFLVALAVLFLGWIAHSVNNEENACRAKGGAPTWHSRNFQCVEPTPTGSK